MIKAFLLVTSGDSGKALNFNSHLCGLRSWFRNV